MARPDYRAVKGTKVQLWGKRSCLNLSHLMELHPEVRNILPELQEVDF